jgi:hypothetical protein
MRTLIVCRTRFEALQLECSPVTFNHKHGAEIRFWWPHGGHDKLRGLRFELVVWTDEPDPADAAFVYANCCYAGTIHVIGEPFVVRKERPAAERRAAL